MAPARVVPPVEAGSRRYATPTGLPCPRSLRVDGTVEGDGACHACGASGACPLLDPWADPQDSLAGV